jgi:hypothetical protein
MINRNAYVYIALKGYGYCEAVGKVFKLLIEYTALLMFVNVLSECPRILSSTISPSALFSVDAPPPLPRLFVRLLLRLHLCR